MRSYIIEEIKIFAFLKIFRKFVQKYFKINLVHFGDSSWKDQSSCSVVDYRIWIKAVTGQTKNCQH